MKVYESTAAGEAPSSARSRRGPPTGARVVQRPEIAVPGDRSSREPEVERGRRLPVRWCWPPGPSRENLVLDRSDEGQRLRDRTGRDRRERDVLPVAAVEPPAERIRGDARPDVRSRATRRRPGRRSASAVDPVTMRTTGAVGTGAIVSGTTVRLVSAARAPADAVTVAVPGVAGAERAVRRERTRAARERPRHATGDRDGVEGGVHAAGDQRQGLADDRRRPRRPHEQRRQRTGRDRRDDRERVVDPPLVPVGRAVEQRDLAVARPAGQSPWTTRRRRASAPRRRPADRRSDASSPAVTPML